MFGKSKDKSPKETGANPHIAQTTTGFANLKDAAAAAPDRTTGDDPTSQGKTTRGRKSAAPPAQPAQSDEDKRKQKLKEEAMEKIGKQICAELAAVPYDTWAFLVNDTEVSLSDEEKKDLTEKYYILAQSIEPDFSSPWFLATALFLQNLTLIAKRLKIRHEKKLIEKQLAADAAGETQAPVN